MRERAATSGLGGHAAGSTEYARLMAALSITYDGRQYEYRGHRYDQLSDAINYAKLEHSRGVVPRVAEATALTARVQETPNESQQVLMASLSITFRDGMYHLGGYRYDRLADAINYAQLRAGHIAP